MKVLTHVENDLRIRSENIYFTPQYRDTREKDDLEVEIASFGMNLASNINILLAMQSQHHKPPAKLYSC